MPDLKGKERIDVTGFGTVKIIQDPDEFCYGVDAVILADIAARRGKAIREESRIMDLGTGSGIIPLILSHKTKAGKIYGVEVQKNSWDRAVRSAELNDLTDRLEFINCDIKDVVDVRPDLKMSFDVITSNPPYTALSGGMKPESTAKCQKIQTGAQGRPAGGSKSGRRTQHCFDTYDKKRRGRSEHTAAPRST